MKRLLFLLAALFLLAGCSSQPSLHVKEPTDIVPAVRDDLYVEAVKGTVTPTGMEYRIVNRTDETWEYGYSYVLQVEENGVWYSLNLTGGVEINGKFHMEFPAIALAAMPGTETGESVNWEGYYGALPDGHYRLIKEISLRTVDGTGAGEQLYLAAEFVLPASAEPAVQDGVYVEIVEGSVTSTGLTYRFVNETENILEYGDGYALYERDGDDWRSVDWIVDSWELNGESEFLRRGTVELEINWEDLYGELPPGEYLLHLREKLRGPDRKVIKERINLNAEFTIPG